MRRPFAIGLFLIIALLFRNLGNGFDLFDELFHGAAKPYAALADIGFLGHNPFKTLAVIMVARAALGWRRRARVALDAVLPVVAATTLIWYLALGPLVLQPSVSPLGGALLTVYSTQNLFNLLLLAAIWRRFPDPGALWSRSLLGVSLTASTVCNVIWQYQVLRGEYAVGSALDAGWMAADVFLGAAAWSFRRAPAPPEDEGLAARDARPSPLVDLLLPYLLIGAVLLLSAYAVVRGEHTAVIAGVHIGACAVVVLVFLRQVLVLDENRCLLRALRQAYDAETELNDALAAARTDLERRVEERTRALRRSEEALKALNVELEDLVSARTAALRLANAELEKFAYSISHDLKAPLRAIDGFSALLVETEAERLSPEGRSDLERVRNATARMASLLDGLLEMSRLQRVEVNAVDVDLTKMASEIVQELRDTEPSREVHVEVSPGLEVRADRRLMHSVLQNLLGNAWKFTGRCESPRIQFGQCDGHGAVFFVSDNGVGFDMAHADKLFGVFQRLHREDDFPGTGVGLATVERIIANHGGRIWAEAEPGGGATFFFTLRTSVDTEGKGPVEASPVREGPGGRT